MTPIEPSEILDPNPERLSCLGGVRQTISPVPAREGTESKSQAVAAHSTFAASLPTQARRLRVWRLPMASTALNIIGQAALGASIATGTVEPAIGATAAVAWMVCGLALIAAQCISVNGRELDGTTPFVGGGGWTSAAVEQLTSSAAAMERRRTGNPR